LVSFKATENLLSADWTSVRLSQFDKAGRTNQVTARQQKSALLTLERLGTHWTLAKAFAERHLHTPELFLQVVTDGMVAALNQQLYLAWVAWHLAFASIPDSLLFDVSNVPSDALAECLGVW
jgi:hypothetical protein